MSVNSVSFWQQDQNFWNNAAAWNQATSAKNAQISEMGQVMANLSLGLSSIANKTALDRVNSQLSAAVQGELQSSGSSSAGSSSASSSSSSSSSSATGNTRSAAAISKIMTTASQQAVQTGGTATAILTADGVTGNLIDMLT